MKEFYSLLYLLLITTTSFGQTKKTETADKLFNSYQFVDAIEAYSKLVQENKADSYVYKQLADSNYNIFNIEEASKWYAKATESKQDAETYYRFSQVLKSLGDYESASKQMAAFSKLLPNDQRAIEFLKNPNYVPLLLDRSKLFEIENTNINDDKQSDFGAVLTNNNDLYFVSTRKNSKRKDSWTNQPYLDIYKSTLNDDGSLTDPEEVEELNTLFHDGPLTISADGKTMFFSRDGHSQGSSKKLKGNRVKLAQQGLYKATLIEGKWSNITPLPINSKDYTVSHPSLSYDGKTLYFASNMSGGFGDSDIWKISVNGNSYGEPENLGTEVNTTGKEGFPFISKNNVLYFASSGIQGLGGLDIFKYDLNKKSTAINLGKGINTKRDDFAFSIDDLKEIGFFSSNRSGADNIYKAFPICKFQIIAKVKDNKTNAKVSNAVVTILDNQNNIIKTKTTTNKGQAYFNLGCDDYTLSVSKDGYETTSLNIENSKVEKIELEALLKPIQIEVNEIITETEVKLGNIYFEFNKSNITQQGASELDKLVKIMNDYPNMKILVQSHTDTKGKSAYNLNLSERRAQATVQYLIYKGIGRNRLSAKGLGSSTPKIDCMSNCSEEEDAQNRRSEFLIIEK
ncbi:OmpA family protein [Olleya sp. R77988]|uniref:OmpA family protein n=1 Tax=Olleya sp. R77988 TaxID=3093875 RepID=UPI0037CC9046